ncbi:MAG TPA: hypothetical protein DCS63_01285 [Elusimicrobia bacterium]|nr:hypothetical protein [Elusimicrobiota bacterium]
MKLWPGNSDAVDSLLSVHRLIFMTAGAAASVIGLLVLAGWHIHNISLIRAWPGMAPMPYNSALGFFLCGGGLVTLAFGEKRPALAGGVYGAAVGVLTLIEYAFGVDFGIDQIFMPAYIREPAAHPGQMPLNAAVCWALMGVSLYLMTKGGESRRRGLALWVSGLTIILISAISFLGYISGTPLAHSWGAFPSMPFHGAVAWLLLGVGVSAYALFISGAKGHPKREMSRAAFGIAMALLAAAGYVAYRNIAATSATANRVALTYEAKENISAISLELKSAGIAYRNYILTGDGRQLELYRATAAAVRGRIAGLRTATASDPTRQAGLGTLEALAARKFRLLDESAGLYTEGRRAAALAALTGEGRAVLTEIQKLIELLDGEEDERLAERRGRFGESLKGAKFSLLVGGVLGAALLTLVFYFLSREARARELTEAELLRASEEASSASKAKSDFIASMSHELRTPLNSILGFAQVLEAGYYGPMNEKQMEYAGDINAAGRHLLDLINDILDIARIESGKMELRLEKLNARELLERTALMFRAKAEEGAVKLDLKVSGDFPSELGADERKLKQVLFNLLSNAFKFTPAGGSVTLAAGIDAAGEPEISVTDTGPGIGAVEQGMLFSPFVQLPGAKTGAGLGLFLCRGMVSLWGGRIGVVSPPGGGAGGSRFYFTLGKGEKHESSGGG